METHLNKGIFGDNVLKHLDQILSGTYISSFWKNGMMNLELHHNGLNNRQVSEWLSEHLGEIWDDFKWDSSLDTMGKVGKGLGVLGTVLTVGTDVADNFYDPESKEWSFSGNQMADCIADIAIDIGAEAGSAAAGAAIGSFFAPPVGTVVGLSSSFL